MAHISEAVQIVGGLVQAVKNTYDLVKDTSDNELKRQIGDLYDVVLDAKVQVIELDAKVRELEEQLAFREEIVGPEEKFGYFHYKSKPDKPLCPKCWQSLTPNAVYLSPVKSGGYRVCLNCGCSYEERKYSIPCQSYDPLRRRW